MARRTTKISLKERISSWKSNRRAREKRLAAIRNWNWVAIVKVAAVICFLAASGAFLRYAEAYVKTVDSGSRRALVLVEVPGLGQVGPEEPRGRDRRRDRGSR